MHVIEDDGPYRTADLLVAAAVNDREVLANCLQRSPDISQGRIPLRTFEKFSSASQAYNQALSEADPGTIIVFAHQDVYLPAGWPSRLIAQLNALHARDADWAVAGLIGVDQAGTVAGTVWTTALDKLIHGEGALPAPVEALDELVLVLRAGSGLRFDDRLPGFHMYGVDIVQEAARAGRRSYAIEAPAIHHDKVTPRLDHGYKAAWRFMRSKWRERLPIPTLIAPLDRAPLRLLETDLRILWLHRGFRRRRVPTRNPAEIARTLGLE